MKKIISLSILFISCCFSVFAITGTEVVEKYFEMNPAPDYTKTEFKVDSYKNGKLDETITLIQYGRHQNSVTETVFEVTKSPALKGTRFLQSQKKHGEDGRFIYMPSLKTVRRIGVQDKSKQFVSTEFSYNDTAMRDTEDDVHTLLKEESVKVGNTTYDCYVVKSDPVIKKNLEFSYRIQYFDKETAMPVKIEYFDRNDKVTKKMEVLELIPLTGATGKKHYCRKSTEMTNFKTGRRSILTIISMELDKEMKSSYFSQNWLSTGK